MPITINAGIPEEYVVPSGTLEIEENGTYDIKAYDSVNVIGDFANWKRPKDWPNYDLLNLKNKKEECIYFTYDNRIKGSWISIYIWADSTDKWTAQRVKIENDGSVTVLSTVNGSNNNSIFSETIPNDADDWVCYKITPRDGKHITQLGMEGYNGKNYSLQPCVERYGYLPFLTKFNIGYSYRDWMCRSVISDTILGLTSELSVNLTNCTSLRNINIENGTIGSFSGTYNLTKTAVKLSNKITSLSAVLRETALKSADFSNITLLNPCTSISYLIYNNHNTRIFKFPKGDYSAVTTTANAFNSATELEVIDLPDTLTYSLATNFTSASCYNCRAVVIRANQVVAIDGTGAINSVILSKGGPRVYVPQSLIEDYKIATNWSSLYESYPDMFGAIEGSEFNA